MNIIQQLLSLDLSLLQSARGLVGLQYAPLVQIAGELVVIYGALLLIILWMYGVYIKNNEYKMIALSIFFTIVTVFIFYTIINLGIHKWRPGAMEISGAIAPLIPHPVDNSFPSGHALFTVALLFGIFKYYHRNSLLILTSVVGGITLSARVIGGVHYPGDILGGLLFGLIGAHLLRFIVPSIVKKVLPICIRIASWIRL